MTITLTLDALTFRYPRGGLAVGPIDGALGPGVYHMQGANGCGKTTLLRLLCGELRPTAGRCLIDARVVWDDPLARRRVGLLPTRPEQPDPLTVRECWRFHAALRGRPDWSGDALCDLLELPPALRLAHASSGQRRRAELLATLAGDPDVLLLDEPFTTLDTRGVAVLSELLEARRTTHVIVLTAHHDIPISPDKSWTLTRGDALTLT